MKKILALVAVGAIAFGIVGAAAASLGTSSQAAIPGQGAAGSVATCTDGMDITYTKAGNTDPITAIVVTDATATSTACNGYNLRLDSVGDFSAGTTLKTGTVSTGGGGTGACVTAAYTAGTGSAAAVWTCTFAAGISVANFNPGLITLTFYQ